MISGADCELLTLHVNKQFKGTGSALLSAVQGIARRAGCTRLSVVKPTTTWMRCGSTNAVVSDLRAFAPGPSTRAEKPPKPEIPASGSYGIPLRDETRVGDGPVRP